MALVRRLWSHRNLVWQLTRREIEGRYRGSFLGIFWSFVSPLVLLADVHARGRCGAQDPLAGTQTDGLGEFALMLFAG